mmetsp:Transcript_31400/g.77815  ORF Transcript_31400/g.77815 Transcript_31400/m.77815 type:complete len:141 (-) Transcript_31400:414-836(-)
MPANNKCCIAATSQTNIGGCTSGVHTRNKVSHSCHKRVCKMHSSAVEYDGFNEVVQIILNVAKRMGMLSEHNFICLNCIRLALIQVLKTRCENNADKGLCEKCTNQELVAQYHTNVNNTGVNNNANNARANNAAAAMQLG